ncbi:MAG: YihA family ribosome biogenesis GTP-binding protein [Deltaproteobacteria bacterium]|nr:YihA family ribosome biogenesis GTP-binding protein [Deltaproteobacteria bacterium]
MDARFVTAAFQPDERPPEDLFELAVVGRSNCGKSSLINALTAHKKLARTSSTPGRTREIIYFRVHLREGDAFHLVDLPGYGYAKVSKTQRLVWDRLVSGYIEGSDRLRAMLLLIDIRREVGDDERDLMRWCQERQLGTLVVVTKADKLPKSRRFAAASAIRHALSLPKAPLLTSVPQMLGIEVLRELVVAELFGTTRMGS